MTRNYKKLRSFLQRICWGSDVLFPQLFRAVEVVWVFALFPSLLTMFFFAHGGDADDLYQVIPRYTALLIQIPLLLLLLWHYSRHDAQMDALFLSKKHTVALSFLGAFRCVVTSYPVWLFLFFWNLWVQWGPDLTLTALWAYPPAKALTQTMPHLWCFLLFGFPGSILYLLFATLAYRRRFNLQKERRLAQPRPFSLWRAMLHLGIWLLNVALIAAFTPVFGGCLLAVINMQLGYHISFWVVLFVILFFFDGLARIRSLRRRKKFLSALKAHCKSRNRTLTFAGHPILSACFPVEGKAMIEENGEVYTLLLPPCHKRGVRVELGEDGSAAYCHEIRFRRYTVFAWQNQYFLTEAPIARCFAVFTTVPHRITANDHRKTELDNGFHYGFLTVYSGNAFLRTLERGFPLAQIEAFWKKA